MAFTDQSGVFIYKLLLTFQLMDQIAENDLMMIQKDGSVALTANWDAGSYQIRAQTFRSDIATGTAPFTVASVTKVVNLNAHSLDVGGTPFPPGNTANNVAISNGTKCTNLNADLLDGHNPSNASGSVPLSNGTVCTDLNADKLDGNHASAFSILAYDGTQVFSGASPSPAFADLDLSARIGSNRALVYIRIAFDAADRAFFRTNGETVDLATSFGCTANGDTDSSNNIVYYWVLADTGGIIEWRSQAGNNATVDLLVYLVVA